LNHSLDFNKEGTPWIAEQSPCKCSKEFQPMNLPDWIANDCTAKYERAKHGMKESYLQKTVPDLVEKALAGTLSETDPDNSHPFWRHLTWFMDEKVKQESSIFPHTSDNPSEIYIAEVPPEATEVYETIDNVGLVTGLTVVGDVGTNLTGLYFALSYGDGWKVVEYSVVTALALTAVGDEVVKVVKLGNKAKNPTRKVAQEVVEYINVDVDLPTGKLKGFSLPTQLKTIFRPLELLQMTNRQEVIQQLVELKVHTHDKLFEAFKKAKINPEFLAKIDARPAWLREWADNILGGVKGLFKNNHIQFSPEDLTQLLKVKWNKDDKVLDLFVHSDINNNLFIYVEDANGKLKKINLAPETIAKTINNLVPRDKAIRLLSCNDLESAQELSKHFDRPIIATDDIVRVHPDGGITTVARSGNDTQKWYRLEGGKKTEANSSEMPKKPDANKADDFVQMGWFFGKKKKSKAIQVPSMDADDLLKKLKLEVQSVNPFLYKWNRFKEDFEGDVSALTAFYDNPKLIEIWDGLDKHDVRKNIGFLEKVEQEANFKRQQIYDLFKNLRAAKDYKGNSYHNMVSYSVTRKIDNNKITIDYDEYGFPDFSDYAEKQFTYSPDPTEYKLKGDGSDMSKANTWVKKNFDLKKHKVSFFNNNIIIDGIKYTWHHLEDGLTMYPVVSKVHTANIGGFSHSGGKAIINRKLQGFFY